VAAGRVRGCLPEGSAPLCSPLPLLIARWHSGKPAHLSDPVADRSEEVILMDEQVAAPIGRTKQR
jgi:hypothetical protein